MAFDGASIDWTFTAGADLSAAANQYKFVEFDGSGNVVVCNAATDVPVGVLQNKPGNGQAATVRVLGISKLQADAAIAIGNLIGTSADGQADPKTAGTDTTEYVVARALTAVSNAGEIFTGFVNCLAPHRAS